MESTLTDLCRIESQRYGYLLDTITKDKLVCQDATE